MVRDYILNLRKKLKYEGHPHIKARNELLSPVTIRCHIRVLKAFSTWLYLEGYTSENRLRTLKLPRTPQKIVEPLTDEEIKIISGCIDKRSYSGNRNYMILITALDTGLRASEITGIKLSNLNLQAGYIKVMGKAFSCSFAVSPGK